MMRNEMSRFGLEQLEHRRLLSSSPAMTISDVTLAEGQDGASAFVFTVSLFKASSKPVSVNFATADSSALAGADYAPSSGTLNFASGQTTRVVTVIVNGDPTVEENETFTLNLSGARNAFIADACGVGTIVNDDVPPPADPDYDPGYDPYSNILDSYDWSIWSNSNTGWGEYP
jgi:chitinase